MYDLPELEDANGALLAALEQLASEEGVDLETGSMTQICGYPLQTTQRGRFAVLGVPCYDLAGCDGPTHRSFIVVAAASRAQTLADLRGGSFAVNGMDSNTGMNLARHAFARFAEGTPFFDEVLVTGSHRASMKAVALRRADAAAIDCVTFGLHAEYDPAAVAGLRILASTSASPAIPFVTSLETAGPAVAGMRRALLAFSARAEFAALRRALRIERIEAPVEAAYDVLLRYRAEAIALGYPHLT